MSQLCLLSTVFLVIGCCESVVLLLTMCLVIGCCKSVVLAVDRVFGYKMFYVLGCFWFSCACC